MLAAIKASFFLVRILGGLVGPRGIGYGNGYPFGNGIALGPGSQYGREVGDVGG